MSGKTEYTIKSSKGHIIFDSSGNITEKNKTPRKHKNKRRVIHPELKEMSEICSEDFWEDFLIGASRGSFQDDIKYSNGEFFIKNRKTTDSYRIDKRDLKKSLEGLQEFFNKHDVYSPDDTDRLIHNNEMPEKCELDPKRVKEEMIDRYYEGKPRSEYCKLVKVIGLKPTEDADGNIRIEAVREDGTIDFSQLKTGRAKEAPRTKKFDIQKMWVSFLKDLAKLRK